MTAALVLGLLGLLLGLALAMASKAFYVEKDARIEKVEAVLPQANCGACGYAGCAAFAEAVVKGEADINGCIPGGGDTAAAIAGILGKKAGKTEKKVAIVHCHGPVSEMKNKFEYQGIADCNAAMLLHGGDSDCIYGCLGYYSCIEACPFDAIDVTEKGGVRVNEEKCVGCGACIEACPKHIIELKPASKQVDVLCSSKDKGADVMKICKVGCIGCKKCEKICPVDAIKVHDQLAVIDYGLCISCGKCAEVCPTHVIHDRLASRFAEGKRTPPVINSEKCIGCTLCAKSCPVQAISGTVKEIHEIDPEKCVCCGICVDKCPKDAILWDCN